LYVEEEEEEEEEEMRYASDFLKISFIGCCTPLAIKRVFK
jgi:hypothetical protein